MKILKYKQIGKDKYKIFLEDKEITLYEDIILKHNILLKKDLTDKDIEKALKENMVYEGYYKTLKYLSTKMRCEKEIRKYLKDNNNKDVDKIIKILKDNNLINEKLYIKAYINDQINLKNTGPNKIKKDLIALNLDKNIIEECLSIFTKELIDERISKIINKNIKTNKKSLYEFKNKMINSLYLLGYDKEDILDNLNNIYIDEKKLKEAEYNKLKNKYSKKYRGEELEIFIKNKLYQKGYK